MLLFSYVFCELDTEEIDFFNSKLPTLQKDLILEPTTENPDFQYDLGSGPIHPSEITPRPKIMDNYSI